MNNSSCEIVQDLLPLYIDGVCSESSSRLVSDHLAECKECKAIETKIRDTKIEAIVGKETESVLDRHAKKERGAAWKAGAIIASILCFPVVIVAIVMANGQAHFDVLAILISSMMLAASLTVVPLMSKEKRFTRVVLSGTASILLIEFFACLSEGASFARAAVPTVFGLSVAFLPFIIGNITLPDQLKDKKALTVVVWDVLWLLLTIAVETIPQHGNDSFREGMVISVLLMVVVFSIFGIVRLSNSRVDGVTKIGIIVILLGLWSAFFKDIAALFLHGVHTLLIGTADLSNWSPDNLNANIALTLLSSALFIGAVFIIIGIVKKIANDK